MTVFSYSQLEQLWDQAGGNPSLAPLMAAIAEAESSGNSNATGGVGEKGLWQINPNAWGSLATYDPLGNAKAAVYVYEHQGLNAWTTYTKGLYKQFLKGGVPPATGAIAGGAAGGVANATLTSNTGGATPSNVWTFIEGGFLGGLFGQDPASAISNPLAGIGAIANDFETFFKWMSWLFNPSNWVRIGAFFVGILALAGAGFMIKEAI